MRISVGIEIGKDIHWITAIDGDGIIHMHRKVENTRWRSPTCGTVSVGLDVIGGIALPRPCWPRPALLVFGLAVCWSAEPPQSAEARSTGHCVSGRPGFVIKARSRGGKHNLDRCIYLPKSGATVASLRNLGGLDLTPI